MTAAFDAIATGTDIQRRIGVKTSRDEPLSRFTTMRVGGPADLFASVHNAFELKAHRPLRAFARVCRTWSSAGAATSSSPTPACVASSSRIGPRVRKVVGDAVRRRCRCPDGAGRDRDAAGRPVRARVRARDPGLGRRRRLGQRRRPRVGDGGGPAVGARPRSPTAPRPTLPVGELGLRLSRQPLQARRPGRARRTHRRGHFELEPADADTIKARLDDIRHWRQAHQPLGLPSAGSVFRNPPGDSAGRLIEAAGLKGRRIGGAVVSEKHANFIVNDQKGTATDVRRLVDLVHAEVLARHGIDLEPEVQFIGDWSGWEVAA